MDFSYLKSISDGDQEFIVEFVETFERNSSKIINDLKSAHQANDNDAQKKLAHQLKPSLEMLGLESLQIALKIQHEVETTTDADIVVLEQECEQAVEAMKTEFNL